MNPVKQWVVMNLPPQKYAALVGTLYFALAAIVLLWG